MNVTTAYPGPLATDTFNQQTIDDIKRPNNKSETFKPSQEPERDASSLWKDPKTQKTQPDTIHGFPHYPMDPGHPTVPYNGPYSPDFIPTYATVEDIFHLPTHLEKSVPTSKEKSKSKSDSKKLESVKPHKEVGDQYFPGPLAPDKFPDKIISMSSHSINESQHVSGSSNSKKLSSQQKVQQIDQPHFIPLNPYSDISGSRFSDNGENVPSNNFNSQVDNPDESLYQDKTYKPDMIDPNIIVSTAPKKKTIPTDPFIDGEKSKSGSILPTRPKQDQRDPNQEILPEHLYHLINLQHPGLIQLDQVAPQGHPGLHDLHQQISVQKQFPNDRPEHFGILPSGPKKVTKPHIVAQKDENGQTVYHIHTSDIPNTPQQIEKLLAHISQHDLNSGPFQHYPGQQAIPHNIPNDPPPTLPLDIDAHIPQSGFTHLNHPFAEQTPNQSGSFLITSSRESRSNIQIFC